MKVVVVVGRPTRSEESGARRGWQPALGIPGTATRRPLTGAAPSPLLLPYTVTIPSDWKVNTIVTPTARKVWFAVNREGVRWPLFCGTARAGTRVDGGCCGPGGRCPRARPRWAGAGDLVDGGFSWPVRTRLGSPTSPRSGRAWSTSPSWPTGTSEDPGLAGRDLDDRRTPAQVVQAVGPGPTNAAATWPRLVQHADSRLVEQLDPLHQTGWPPPTLVLSPGGAGSSACGGRVSPDAFKWATGRCDRAGATTQVPAGANAC
jgi:hypothetical protein